MPPPETHPGGPSQKEQSLKVSRNRKEVTYVTLPIKGGIGKKGQAFENRKYAFALIPYSLFSSGRTRRITQLEPGKKDKSEPCCLVMKASSPVFFVRAPIWNTVRNKFMWNKESLVAYLWSIWNPVNVGVEFAGTPNERHVPVWKGRKTHTVTA